LTIPNADPLRPVLLLPRRIASAPSSTLISREMFVAAGMAILLASAGPAAAQGQPERRFTISLANLTEDPAVLLEGTGFTGPDVRGSFSLAARLLPVEMVFQDNAQDNAKALANADDAIRRKVDVYILYHGDSPTNAEIVRRLRQAGIPVLALIRPAAGAPLYTVDNRGAGTLAGERLGRYAVTAWAGKPVAAIAVGNLALGGPHAERVAGVRAGIKAALPSLAVDTLDTQGQSQRAVGLVTAYLANHAGHKVLIAAMDDATALAAKSAVEMAGRQADAAIVSQGADRSIHGGMNDKKEIDPNNRGSIVVGSVAFYLDRLGQAVLPLALQLAHGQSLPEKMTVAHELVTAANVFILYPPYDMN
jgi:ribose transport system substrate-binding protein